jgi:hypothetical protein
MSINLDQLKIPEGGRVKVTLEVGSKVIEQRFQRCKDGWACTFRTSRTIH